MELEHSDILRRLSTAEKAWKLKSTGKPIANLFTDHYAGLFRNPRVENEAQEAIYNAHLYPVFTPGRCRLNITGLPEDTNISSNHVEVFAKYCHE